MLGQILRAFASLKYGYLNLLYEYLFHFVQIDKFVSEVNKSLGSKMPRADWGVVSEMVFKILDIDEQQKIATVLTYTNKEIELFE